MIFDKEKIIDEKLFLQQRITIASYPGGKSDKKKHIPLFLATPPKIFYLIEPFAGLANFFLVISPRVSKVWLNDKDPEVFALLRCMNEENLLTELIEYVQSINPVEREDYYEWKAKKPVGEIEKAIRKLVILNCSPNGAGGGYSSAKAHRKWYMNKPKVWEKIHSIFIKKVDKITKLDYFAILEQAMNLDSKKTFIYLDPPYYDVAKKGKLYGTGLNVIEWAKFRESLQRINIPFILSNRDMKETREEFNSFYLHYYNTYNDMNNTQNKNPELMISNRPFTFLQNNLTLDTWL